MFKQILLPTDGSPLSEAAIRKGVDFARLNNAKVTGLYVAPEFHTVTADAEMLEATPSQYEQSRKARADKYLAQITQAAAEAGVECEATFVTSDQPFEAIIATAKEKGCDLIVMASHGRSGLKGLLLGSVTQKVLTHTTLPVLVLR